MQGQKHLIECKCILPQFANKKPIIYHCFVVFSEIDDETGELITHYEQCNNCSAIHKIVDFCKSELCSNNLLEENKIKIVEIDEIRRKFPPNLIGILEASNSDVSTWKEVQFNLRNELWGKPVVLSKEEDGDEIKGKLLKIFDKKTFKVEDFRDEKFIKR